jgi:hypothetical protein
VYKPEAYPRERRRQIEGVSLFPDKATMGFTVTGTSAGAMNGAVLVDGLVRGGLDGGEIDARAGASLSPLACPATAQARPPSA